MAIPNGDIYLLKDVPLTANYEHTIDFKNKSEQFGYFSKFIKTTLSDYTYIRKEREYLTAELPIHALDNVNYMIFQSTEEDRIYYAFVTNKVYINDEVSQIFYTIDVMQTYQFDYEWKASFIKQGHVDRWTAEHKPIYSKTEENIDYGSEYIVENGYKIEQSKRNIRWLLISLVDYREIVEEGHVLSASYVYPVPNTFACLLVPVFSKGGINDVEIINKNYDTDEAIGKIGDYRAFVYLMLNSALGNYVRNITLLTYNPFILNETQKDGITTNIELNGSFRTVTFGANGTSYKFLLIYNIWDDLSKGGRTLAKAEWNIGIEDSLPTSKQWEEIKAKPYTTPRDKRFESKLLCYPYRYNLLTDWRSSPVVFKNEFIPDKIELLFTYSISYNAPFRFWLKDYKRDTQGRYTTLSQPLGLEFPVISDAYYTYMLENKNTIQANLTNTAINAVSGTINGAISGGGIGGVGGAVFGAISGGVAGGLNVQALIRSENAKQRDLQAKPDTVINSTDSAFQLLDDNTAISFYRMRICCENEDIIAQIFNMQGYTLNRVEIPNTKSRTRFNYIQTIGANIVGSINQSDLLKIKEIYDKGVTIWHYKESNFNILDYSYENIEVSLI